MAEDSTLGVPVDATEVMKDNDWLVYYSLENRRLYVYPTSYHPRTLELSYEMIQGFLRVMDGQEERPEGWVYQ